MRAKTDKIVRSWKASPEDMDILNSLKEAQVEASETARVRAGLRLLAAKEDMRAFHDNEYERLTPGRGFKR
jgi:hypothetical protein